MAQAKHETSALIQRERKRALIDATITAIAEHGLSNLTLAKVAGLAGLTAGTVNFHFASKQALLIETLRRVSVEFSRGVEDALTEAGNDPVVALDALIETTFDARLSEARKVAVWYAFLAEARSRSEYQQLCGERDDAFFNGVLQQCVALIRRDGSDALLDAEAIAYALTGVMEQLWQEILFIGDDFDREAAKMKCRSFLASIFPQQFPRSGAAPAPDGPVEAPPAALAQEGEASLTFTLPAWVYRDEEFFELEKKAVFLPSWQLVCHESDLAAPGSYVTYNMLGERAFVIRDDQGTIHALHNVCRHRAHAVVQGEAGTCQGFLQCPYHGWTYHLDGTHRAVSAPNTFRGLDRSKWGLKPLDCEVFQGFVFIRFQSDGPSVAERFAPYREEFERYRTAQMVHVRDWEDGDGFWLEEVDIDWKNGVENYVEDYHFPIGHRGLSALMESAYDREPSTTGMMRLSHRLRTEPRTNWSARHYANLLPDYEHLPADMRRRWSYFVLLPNTFLDMFPDKMDFFQMIPTAPGKVLLRGRSYCLPDDSRRGRALRYLNDRINRRVQEEDNHLTASVQKGLGSSAYDVGILSDKECLVHAFQTWVRERIPAARHLVKPASLTPD